MIDQIPDSELSRTAALFVAARSQDRVRLHALLSEEEDPEPGDLEALAEVDRTDTISVEDLKRQYGMTFS